jgi:hypothetical protein
MQKLKTILYLENIVKFVHHFPKINVSIHFVKKNFLKRKFYKTSDEFYQCTLSKF